MRVAASGLMQTRAKKAHTLRMRSITFKARHRRYIERFTELLSEEVKPCDAAEQIGLHRKTGDALLREVRADLGWQAQ